MDGKSDLISRQAAIDALNSGKVKEDGMHLWRHERNETLDVAVELINTLPSAEPEIIRCKDCKWWGREDMFKDGSSVIVCKKGRSADPEGYCHCAERRTDE